MERFAFFRFITAKDKQRTEKCCKKFQTFKGRNTDVRDDKVLHG
jgi:hypothetical protein